MCELSVVELALGHVLEQQPSVLDYSCMGFKGKSPGNQGIHTQNYGFPADIPLNQFMETISDAVRTPMLHARSL